jgi:hypothetical protein
MEVAVADTQVGASRRIIETRWTARFLASVAAASLISLCAWSVASAAPADNVQLLSGASAGNRQASVHSPFLAADPGVSSAQIVVLVDESGSISESDMIRERDAAGLIAQAEFSPNSSVAVIGFGSDDGGESALDIVCPSAPVDTVADRQHFSDCVRGLQKRQPSHGDNTDHVQALNQALTVLAAGPANESRIVFLLTDGVLDVGASPQYGADKTPAQRNQAAAALLGQAIDQARQDKIQIWPLGFGASLDRHALDNFAAGGYQGTCGPGSPTPSATVVASSSDVDSALLHAYGAARCAGVGPIQNTALAGGQSVDVTVSIPAIATNGSITVIKQNDSSDVEYVDPAGHTVPKDGSAYGSTFQVSGDNGPVESLRIVDPVPGNWRVHVTAPGGAPSTTISTAVTWQGAVQASLVLDPPEPAAGQPMTVTMQLHLRSGKLVTDQSLLSTLSFTTELRTGNRNIPIAMADNGRAPDIAVDGSYTGQVIIPANATGLVTVAGHVHGIGISGDDPVATTRVAPGLPSVLIAAQLPGISDLTPPGGQAQGTINVTNNTGHGLRLRLLLEHANVPGITIPGGDVQHVVDGSGGTFTFAIDIAGSVAAQQVSAVIAVVDDTNPTVRYAQKSFTTVVGVPPWPWWVKALIGLAVLIVAGLAVWGFVAWRRSRQDKEIAHFLLEADFGGMARQLPTGGTSVTRFRFVVDLTTQPPVLREAEPGETSCYVLTRSAKGLRVTPPSGPATSFFDFDQRRDIGDGLMLTVSDERPDKQSAPTDHHGRPDATWAGDPAVSTLQRDRFL